MATESTTTAIHSDTEYRKWARNLVGKDWEIFWQEEEDGNEEAEAEALGDLNTEPIDVAVAVTIATTTASGQETAEEKMKETMAATTTNGIEVVEMEVDDVNVQMEDSSSDKVMSIGYIKATTKPNESKEITNSVEKEKGEKNSNDDDDDATEGSVIDDWYDGHVLGITDDISTAAPIGKNGWKFRVVFLGDEEAYEVFLAPNKVRASARGWVQRTIALLNPPITAAGENKEEVEEVEEESNLPPDTSTLEDQQSLQTLKSKIADSSNLLNGLTMGKGNTGYNSEVLSLPSYNSFRRIQSLRFQLESQIYLREKISKIENHSGKELFTNGVRNPTENYVNYLVQCCKDLAQACSWYCKSWKLLFYYFGNTPTATIGDINAIHSRNIICADEKACNTGEEEQQQRQPTDLGKLSFEGLIREYLEFGKNTIVNAAMIDVNATSRSNKRRQAIAPDSGSSSNRRTKRRRKSSKDTMAAGAEEETDETNGKLLTAASKLDTEILSKDHVDTFVNSIAENISYRHIATLGNMLQSLSHLVVDPLVSWKRQSRRILGINNKGNDAYNLMIDRIDTKVVDKTKTPTPDTSSDDEEVEDFFSDEQIEACLSVIRNNNVLSRFNLFDDVHKLHAKLADIQKNEAKALSFLNVLSSDTTIAPKKCYNLSQDNILSGLTAMLNDLDSPESSLYNVDPLSTKKSMSVLTRGDLSKAIELRAWFVGVQHAQSVRERDAFLRRLLSKIEPINMIPEVKDIPVLASIPQICQRREALIQGMLVLQARIKNYSGIIEQRENDFLAASSSAVISNSTNLKSHLTFLLSALSDSKEFPVIFPVEEKIAAQIDLIKWYEKVNNVIRPASVEGNNSLSFFDLKNVYDDLQSVLRGVSFTRATLTDGVESDSKIDEEICKFLLSDLFLDCGKTINEVTTLYHSSSSWKKRAESVILCLRTHGNSNAGKVITLPKLPAMVDIKRIVDLTKEYPGLKIEIPGYYEQLERIQSEAYQWSQNLYTTMVDEHRSFTDALSFIQREKDHRPKGIIIYPTRIVADTTVDFLSWYEKIKRTAKVVAGELKQTSIGDNPQEVAAVYSDLVIREFYPILADGSEALEIYCSTFKTSNEMPGQFKANSDQSLEMLEKHFRIRRTSRAPSREKMNSNDLVSSLLSRMNSKDASEEFPLQLILWFQWHLLVADFVSQRDNDEDSGRYQGLVRSLLQAEQIKSQNPFLARAIDLSDAPNTRTLIQTKTTELLELDRIVEDAQNAEGSIKKGLATTKELLRGSLFEKAERIRKHLSSLRVMQSMLKARSLGNGGLSINGAFENPLEKHIKYFSWLVRTLQYLVLHEGEASYSSSSTGDGVEPLRIPLNALVSIHERMPSEISEFGDPILCVLRVRELYTEAKKWQDEVSRSTLISNRGNKRRGTKLENSMQPENQESDKDAKLRMRKMEMLAEDRILSKVDMPRHKAVKAMVDAKKEFEIQLESFLAQDFDGNQDNAPLPKGDSLVGRNGQFILYRLTGSSLFSMMQTSVQSLATIGDNVFAVTRGKAAFDWMRSAVAWIEELQDAVISQSKFTNANEKLLVIPTKDAKQLCKSGGNIFLQANKDVTQTLSNHGIYVSVNSIKKRLNVRLKKDGAHHSVGGIIIRWCPILFNALRADVTKLESWEDGLQKVVDNFNAFESKSSHANAIVDENNLYQWYCYYMEVQTALEEGQNALVVSPTKDTIDYFTDTLGTIRTHLDKNCSRDAIKEFSKRLFGNSTSLYEDRFDLLDALLYRRETARIVDNDIEETEFSALETKASFRDVCRSNLENALLRAAWVLNLESLGVSGIEDLCALKSWEIELEMFETFQDETTFTVFTVSEVYKVKARSLKSYLENTSNISLCLEVLTDDIKANALVKMTPDQFASRNLKLERERAKQAALTEKLSTPEVDSRTTRENYGKPLKSILRKKNAPSRDTSASPEAKIEEKLVNSCNDDTKVNLDLNADGAPTMDSDEDKLVETHLKPSSAATQISGLSPSISPLNPLPVGNKLKNRSSEIPRSPPPPPPPSLASSFDTTSAKDDTRSSSVDSKSRISNMFGGESFRIELQGQLKYTFSAAFYQEDTSQATVNRFMSESLIQKGRSKIDDFDRFLSEKLRGGRWEATCLKLATIGGDRDATIYKAFYKDFEAKERIAMFKLSGDSGSKLFLVTPKFHHIARRTRGITFGNKNSTYAIVLTKKEDEDMWD